MQRDVTLRIQTISAYLYRKKRVKYSYYLTIYNHNVSTMLITLLYKKQQIDTGKNKLKYIVKHISYLLPV